MINELDGLAKGSKEGQYDTAEHAVMVRSGAESAIRFLEAEFESRGGHIRAMTSKGTTMDTIAFRSEESMETVSLKLLVARSQLRWMSPLLSLFLTLGQF